MKLLKRLFGGSAGKAEKQATQSSRSPEETLAAIQDAKARIGGGLPSDVTTWDTILTQGQRDVIEAFALGELLFERLEGRQLDIHEHLLLSGLMSQEGPVPFPPLDKAYLYRAIALSQFQMCLVLGDDYRGRVIFTQPSNVSDCASHRLGTLSFAEVMALAGVKVHVLAPNRSSSKAIAGMFEQKKAVVVAAWDHVRKLEREVVFAPGICTYACASGCYSSPDIGFMHLERYLASHPDWTR